MSYNNFDKRVRHQELCDAIHDLYLRKNQAYGDSFGKTYDSLGVISAITRISDKYNRLVNLVTNPNIPENDESVSDTLMDLANYCFMTLIEIQAREEKQVKGEYGTQD